MDERRLAQTAGERFRALLRVTIRAGASSAWGKFTGRSAPGWGALDPQAVADVVAQLGDLKGLPMKLGQLAGYVDESLPAEARRLLASLQTHSAEVSFGEVEATLRDELGESAEPLLSGLERKPVASASIGQVYRATLDGRRLAVKVQYPGISAAIANEMQAAAAAVKAAALLMPGSDIASYVAEVRERLLEECDYTLEAQRQRVFAANFATHATLKIPQVDSLYSRRRVLTMSWEDGVGFEAWLSRSPAQAQRNRFGAALYEFYIGSLYRYGLFNADPHPGNYLFTDDRLVVLDFGCVRAFTPAKVKSFVALRDAVVSDDSRALRAALVGIGAHDPTKPKALETARTLMLAFFAPLLQDKIMRIEPASRTELGRLLADKMRLMQLGLPGELLFLFRIKFGLYAVLARMGAEANWYALERAASAAALLGKPGGPAFVQTGDAPGGRGSPWGWGNS